VKTRIQSEYKELEEVLKEKVNSVAMIFNFIIKEAENITPPKNKAVSFKEY
jgi:hypothetical protein